MKKFNESIDQRLTARHRKSFQFSGKLKNKDILDIGCSFGWFEKLALESKCRSVVGIEPEEKLFYEAQKEVPKAIFKKGSALEIPVKDKYFDKVVMFDVLEHIPKGTERQALKEIKRVLKPGGTVVISTPFSFWLSKVLDPAWYFGHRHYREKQLVDMLSEVGFKIEKIEKKGRIFEISSAFLMYIFKWFFRREIPFKDWFEKKKDAEYLTDIEGFETLFIRAIC